MFLRWITGFPISLALMPAQFLAEYNALYDIDYKKMRESRKEQGVTINNKTIGSTHGAVVDFCEVSDEAKKSLPLQEQKVIIHAMGASDFYENHLHEYVALAKKNPDYRIIGLNFRGVMKSKGRAWSENDWVDDIITVVNYYLAKGVDIENILLHGHSMGGALSTLAAAKIYQDNLKKALKDNPKATTVKSVKLLNNRSFANLTDEIIISILRSKKSALLVGAVYGFLIGVILGISPLISIGIITLGLLTTLSISERFIQKLLHPWLEVALWLTFGRMDAAQAYKSLPEHIVDHIVVKNDAVIRDKAGMHEALKPLRSARKAYLKTIIEKAQNKREKQVKTAYAELLNLKDSKVQLKEDPSQGFRAHVVPLDQLITYHHFRRQQPQDRLPKQLSGEEVANNKMERLLRAKM